LTTAAATGALQPGREPTARWTAVPREALFLEYREASDEILTPELFPRADGTTWVCAISTVGPLPVDPADVAADAGAHARLEALCRNISPALAAAPIKAWQACFRPVTEDGLPFIGAVPGVDGAFVATGHSVWGMLNAPATGEAMSELILDGAARHVDLAPFTPGRLPPLNPARLRGLSEARVPCRPGWSSPKRVLTAGSPCGPHEPTSPARLRWSSTERRSWPRCCCDSPCSTAAPVARLLHGWTTSVADRGRPGDARAEQLRPLFAEMAGLSARKAAEELNRRSVATPARGKWYAATVHGPSKGPACRKVVLPGESRRGRTDPPPSAQAKHAPSRCEPRSRATARRGAH
jgi:FAD dependent oxidoreductase